MIKIFLYIFICANLLFFLSCQNQFDPNTSSSSITNSEDITTESDFLWEEVDEQIILTKYLGNNKIVRIPATINGKQVVELSHTFEENKTIESVYIPDGISIIGDKAFHDCDALTQVSMPDSVIAIGFGAFSFCDSLVNLNLSNNLQSIGLDGISHCWSLETISIPASVSSINESFCYCSVLTAINVNAENTSYKDIDGVLFTADEKNLLQYPCGKTTADYTIPSSVTTINYQLTFAGNDFMKTLNIPEGVTSIPKWLGVLCRELNAINVDPSNTMYKSDDGVLFTKDGSLLMRYPQGKSDITSFIINISVTNISTQAFRDCISLRSVFIPDSVTEIGSFAFGNCYNLTSVNIGSGVSSIGDGSFYYCMNLGTVIINAASPPLLGGSFTFENNAEGRKIYVPSDSVLDYSNAEYWKDMTLDIVPIQ